MTLRQTLQAGLAPTLRAGLSNFPGGGFPTSAAELVVATGGYGTWTHNWRCSEAAGNLVDDISGLALVPGGAPTYQAAGAIAGDFAVNLGADGAANRFVSGSAAALDHALDEFALLVTFRCTAVAAANRHFCGKVGVSPTFWGLQVNAGGQAVFSANDGVALFTRTVASADHDDGLWHDVLCIVDRPANRMVVQSDLGSSGELDITAMGSVSNATFFSIGRTASVTGPVVVSHVAHSSSTTGMRANAAAIIATWRASTGR